MYKITILSLLLVVGMGVNAQKVDLLGFHKVYVNDKGDHLSDCWKFVIFGRGKIAYCDCGSNDTIVLDPVGLVRNYLEVENIAWRNSETIDSLRKEADSLKKFMANLYRLPGIYPRTYQMIDPMELPGDTILGVSYKAAERYTIVNWTTIDSIKLVRPTPCTTYHDHMPTQLTIKKRHKHHKWVKKSPPDTKD